MTGQILQMIFLKHITVRHMSVQEYVTVQKRIKLKNRKEKEETELNLSQF